MSRVVVACLFLITFTCCQLFQSPPKNIAPYVKRVIEAEFTSGTDRFGRTPDSYETSGKEVMISSEGIPATEIALEILHKGGNAVDAAVALSFAIGVYRPHSTGIGGGGFMLIYNEKGAALDVLDMRERAPKAASRDMYLDASGNVTDKSRWGVQSVATPGLVAGLWEAYLKKGSGKISWKDLVTPSVSLARDGFKVDSDLAAAIDWVREKGFFERFPEAQTLLAPKGTPLVEGDTYKNENLAKALETIADQGKAGFYSGWIAKDIVATIKAKGGVLTQGDLDAYGVKYLKPVRADFMGYEILSMPPPSSGGVHIVQMLNMAEVLISDKEFESVDSLHLKAEIMRRAFADRSKFLGDPAFTDVPVAGITSEAYATKLASGIDRAAATPSEKLKPGDPNAFEKVHTTHFSIVDKEGIAVSSTQTINYNFGSLVVTPKSGIFLNDEMDDFSAKPGASNLFGLVGGEANAIAPEKTPLSSMSPTIVTKNGKVVLVLGSPGGSKIITSVWNVLFNVLHHGMTLRDAVFAPRLHHQWLPDTLQIETRGLDPRTVEALAAKGHRVELLDRIGIGSVTAVQVDPATGTKIGVADPRRGGFAAGY